MTTHKIAPAPSALTLVVGTEELLADRAVSLVVAGARGMDPQTDVRDISAGDLTFPAIQEFLSPSLFSERRVVVVRGLG
ncbi:MAG: DNA polymerase III subunit delta, partial [Actinobacteria bacterium]|nr:DNA polymerase III subunit delta [Actinomycetota bacterium]